MADQRTSLISPALRAECNTARAGSDKSIGLQVILNGNAVNKLGGSRCADLTATDACEAMHPPKPKEKTNKQVEKTEGYIGWKRPGTIAILGATDSNVN